MPSLALVFNAFVWGVSWFPFRHIEAHGLHPVWATALIYALIFVAMGCLRRHTWRAFSLHPALVFLGLAAGLTNVCFNWAVTAGDVVRVVLLFYLMPLWSALLAWIFLGERPTPAALARVALALVGVAVVLKTPQVDWPVPASLADWLGVAAGFAFAVTNILLRQLRAAPGESRALAMFGGCALVAGATALAGTALGVIASPPPLAAAPGWLGWRAGRGLRLRQRLPAVRRRAPHGQRDLGHHAVGGAVRQRVVGGARCGQHGHAHLDRRRADRAGRPVVVVCANAGRRG